MSTTTFSALPSALRISLLTLAEMGAADGLCAIDIKNKLGVPLDITTGAELSRAAELVLDLCVKGYMQRGGIAVNIGE